MVKNKLISIVVPMFNEFETIDTFFITLKKYIDIITKEKNYISFEVIAVNDGSNDDTLSKLIKQNENNDFVSIVSLSRNFGQEPAIFAGLQKAKGDAVIVMDCDLQDPPEFIPQMVQKWEEGFEIVNARRVSRKKDTKFKRDTASIFYKILNKLSYKVKYPTNVNNFRLVSRKVLDIILSMPENNKFYRGLVAFTGFKSYEIDIERKQRQSGKSKYNLKAMTNLAIDGITATTIKPLFWAFKIGLFFSIIGFLGAITLIILSILKINFNITLCGIVCALSFFSGIVLIFNGILGIYIGKSYEEIKARPFNIIDFYLPCKKDISKEK